MNIDMNIDQRKEQFNTLLPLESFHLAHDGLAGLCRLGVKRVRLLLELGDLGIERLLVALALRLRVHLGHHGEALGERRAHTTLRGLRQESEMPDAKKATQNARLNIDIQMTNIQTAQCKSMNHGI